MKKFEVRFPSKDLLVTGACYLAFEALCVYMFVLSKQKSLMVLMIVLSVMFAMIVVVNCLFHLRVSDDVFKVRTRFGKSYRFDLKDIKEIECSNHYRPKSGPLYEIIIYTDGNDLELNHSMENFDIFAGYLLAKYENGEFRKGVLSMDDIEMLKKFAQIKK